MACCPPKITIFRSWSFLAPFWRPSRFRAPFGGLMTSEWPPNQAHMPSETIVNKVTAILIRMVLAHKHPLCQGTKHVETHLPDSRKNEHVSKEIMFSSSSTPPNCPFSSVRFQIALQRLLLEALWICRHTAHMLFSFSFPSTPPSPVASTFYLVSYRFHRTTV